MVKPRRIDIGERAIDGWSQRSYIWEDMETRRVIGYNHHFQRRTASGFVEFVRLDHHRRGDPSEDSPHAHIRLVSRESPGADESVETFRRMLHWIPRLAEVIR